MLLRVSLLLGELRWLLAMWPHVTLVACCYCRSWLAKSHAQHLWCRERNAFFLLIYFRNSILTFELPLYVIGVLACACCV